MNIVLWVFQIALALIFGYTGLVKLTQPMEQIMQKMTWAADLPEMAVRVAGISEMLAAAGLILPSVLRIMPRLTVYAADGLIAVMLSAAILHGNRGEYIAIAINIALASVCLFVAWGRKHKAPIDQK